LREVAPVGWVPYKDPYDNYAYKGIVLGFEIRVYLDTGDNFWRAVTNVCGQTLSPWNRTPAGVLTSLHYSAEKLKKITCRA